jgi:ubiquinone/menaquinone biosynthesis C-methylase UbiE
MNESNHWEEIYSTKSANQVGWYSPHLETSLSWISDLKLSANDPIIDVGGGASTLVDDLLNLGYKKLTVLDLAEKAIRVTKQRLGEPSKTVTWLHGDATEIKLPLNYYFLWHDRAVFHFFIDAEKQQKYRDAMLRAIMLGGYLIIGAFSKEAPPKCSGLPVHRYTADLLCEKLGDEFKLIRHQKEMHRTPSGVEQSYVYCLFRRSA